jgi:hypothetical protein
MSIFAGGCGLMGLAFLILSSVFWFWMMLDCATNPALSGTDKVVWLLVIIFLHFLGAIIYYLVGRRRAL